VSAQDVGVREIPTPGEVALDDLMRAAAQHRHPRWTGGLPSRDRAVESGVDGSSPKRAKLVEDDRLRAYVQDPLAGGIRCPDRTPAAGPATPEWNSLSTARCSDRRRATTWSPKRISHRLPADLPDDASMQFFHEATYQAPSVHSRPRAAARTGRLLWTGRALPVPALQGPPARPRPCPPRGHDQRTPVEAHGRAIPGPGRRPNDRHRSVSDRQAGGAHHKNTMVLHLPRMAGCGMERRVKNRSVLGSHGAKP
jgi:hypothetical protein